MSVEETGRHQLVGTARWRGPEARQRNRFDPELVHRTDHPYGDFASVRDQHPIEHGH